MRKGVLRGDITVEHEKIGIFSGINFGSMKVSIENLYSWFYSNTKKVQNIIFS